MNEHSKPDQDEGKWEVLSRAKPQLMRMKVPGGWLVAVRVGSFSLSFYPDPEHKWNPPLKK